ncbi:putative flagellar hook-length control protein [Phaeobacter piscinae]|nr:putative flagellar hook-length control protein [Phaeobacter piscinae]
MFINAVTSPTSGGAQGSEKIQQGESAKSRKGASFDAVMAKTANSSEDAGSDVAQVEEVAEQQATTAGASEKTNQTTQDGDAEAARGEVPQEAVDQAAAKEAAADPEVPAIPAQLNVNVTPQKLTENGRRDGATAENAERQSAALPQPDVEGAGAAGEVNSSAEGSPDRAAVAPGTGTDAAAAAEVSAKVGLPSEVKSDGSKGSPGNAPKASTETGSPSQQLVADAEGQSTPGLRSDSAAAEAEAARDVAVDGRRTGAQANITPLGPRGRIVQTDAVSNPATSTQPEVKPAAASATAAAQSEMVKDAAKPSVVGQTQPVQQANTAATPTPLEGTPSPVRENLEARRTAVEQMRSPTPTQTAAILPQGTYSVASFGLGAGALSAAMPTSTSALAIDPALSAEVGGSAVSGGSSGFELPGLSQLLTEATLSPGTVHKPETPRLIANQMAEALATKGERNVDVALNPKELGHVNMRVSVTETGVSVMIQTERAETGDLMRRHINELADEFKRMGFEDISFQFSGDEASNQSGGRGEAHTQAGRSAGLGDEDLADLPAEPMTQSLNLGEVGLDMRI